MKRASFGVLFFIKRAKKHKNGKLPVYARITINGLRAEFVVQASVEEILWDNKLGKVNGTSKQAKEVNTFLESVKVNIVLKKRELEETGQQITALQLRTAFIGIDLAAHTIMGVFKEHNEMVKGLVNKDFAPGTLERYNTCYKHVEDFIKLKYKRSDMSLFEINPMFIRNFEYYLKTTRDCSNNTTIKYIKNFKKIIRIAMANGWMKEDPFRTIKYHLDEVDMAYLTEEELKLLMNKHFELERLQLVRDTYVFCCFTGLAFVDVASLKYTDIEDKSGKLWIKKKRQKTKNWCTIPLLEPAIQLMDKYKENPRCIANGYVLPVLSNQKMNAYLKEIADLCGINKNLSTHTARHTFATTVTLSNQVSMEVVSKMLGHSSINMTKKYARVVDDLVSRDMQKLVGMYDKVIAN
jgi:site-specific recombinase XerD